MKKLSDTQLILLSTAAARDNGSIMPFSDSLTAPADRIRKAIAALLDAACAEEGEVQDAANAWRQDGDAQIGLRITATGRVAIGAGEVNPSLQPAPAPPQGPLDAPVPKGQTKTAMVLGMLKREDGATLAELIIATGWLPHTTRAALTGLRKKSHQIEKSKRGEDTAYRIASVA